VIKRHLFLQAPINVSCILTYYLLACQFSFWLLLNILWNSKWFCIIRLQWWQCCCTPHTLHYTTSQSVRQHLFHLRTSVATEQAWPQFRLHGRCSSEFISHMCITLMKWSSTCWIFGMKWATAQLMQLMSTDCGFLQARVVVTVGIFKHVCG